MLHRFTEQLGATVNAAAAPYGYTLTTFATGSMVVRAHPTGDTFTVGLLYTGGSIGAFVVLAWLAAGRRARVQVRRAADWHTHVLSYAHVVACGVAITCGMVVLRLTPVALAAVGCGFVATFAYVFVCAVQFAIGRSPERARDSGTMS